MLLYCVLKILYHKALLKIIIKEFISKISHNIYAIPAVGSS